MPGQNGQTYDPNEEPPPRGGWFWLVNCPFPERLDRAFRGLSAIPIAAGMVLALSGVSASALDCKNAVTTPDLNECADRDYKTVDRRLNETYRQAVNRIEKGDLPPEGQRAYKQALQDAQRKWIPFRDAECELARFEAYGGTMATLLQIGCLTKQTEGRIKELQGVAVPQ